MLIINEYRFIVVVEATTVNHELLLDFDGNSYVKT
jgi:hypothetical protein